MIPFPTAGIPGIIAVPSITLSLEKSFYDTANAYNGLDPNDKPQGLVGSGFPSGGE
jgi:hypothetical protein